MGGLGQLGVSVCNVWYMVQETESLETWSKSAFRSEKRSKESHCSAARHGSEIPEASFLQNFKEEMMQVFSRGSCAPVALEICDRVSICLCPPSSPPFCAALLSAMGDFIHPVASWHPRFTALVACLLETGQRLAALSPWVSSKRTCKNRTCCWMYMILAMPSFLFSEFPPLSPPGHLPTKSACSTPSTSDSANAMTSLTQWTATSVTPRSPPVFHQPLRSPPPCQVSSQVP